jgi:hypothetical protein
MNGSVDPRLIYTCRRKQERMELPRQLNMHTAQLPKKMQARLMSLWILDRTIQVF